MQYKGRYYDSTADRYMGMLSFDILHLLQLVLVVLRSILAKQLGPIGESFQFFG
jgi:hypothetical protein